MGRKGREGRWAFPRCWFGFVLAWLEPCWSGLVCIEYLGRYPCTCEEKHWFGGTGGVFLLGGRERECAILYLQ